MVGSEARAMPFSSRLTNTDATWGRSCANPVSFSTIEARVTASSGVRNGRNPHTWHTELILHVT